MLRKYPPTKIARANVQNIYNTLPKYQEYLGLFYDLLKVKKRICFSHSGLWPICHVYLDGTVCFHDHGNWSWIRDEDGSILESDNHFVVKDLPDPMTEDNILDMCRMYFDKNLQSSFDLWLSSCHPYVQELWRKQEALGK